MHLLKITVILIFYLLLLAAVVRGIRRYWKGKTVLRRCVVNLLLVFTSLVSLGVALETYHYLFMIHSDGMATTLAKQEWLRRHWEPINRYGYRDYDYSPESLQGKNIVQVVGDSFTAGAGIAHIEDRYQNQLAAKLGEEWCVMTLAQPGWDTRQELEALKRHPVKPDVIVWQYFLNDIEQATRAAGKAWAYTPPQVPSLLSPLVEKSFFINHWFWEVYRWRNREYTHLGYWEFVRAGMQDPAIMASHKRALQEVVDYARSRDIPLAVIVFPLAYPPGFLRELSDEVVVFFQAQEVPVLDLTPVLSNRNSDELVCSRYDAHPNASVHAEAGRLLYDFLVEEHLVSED